MATRGDPAVWPCLIKAIWARRLTQLASREGAESQLRGAWSAAISSAWSGGWELDGIVPLAKGYCEHHWAIVCSRTAPTAHMLLIHGVTPLEALERTPEALIAEAC